MYSIVAADWSKTTMHSEFKSVPAFEKLSTNAESLLEIVVENNLEQLFETLKLYFKKEDDITT
jgi:hypothetical protein